MNRERIADISQSQCWCSLLFKPFFFKKNRGIKQAYNGQNTTVKDNQADISRV